MRLFIINRFAQMRYEFKFIKHRGTKYTPKWKELVAEIEFSEGDLMELRKILNESKNTWGTQLIIDIENAFASKCNNY